jgi:hypothetical protein
MRCRATKGPRYPSAWECDMVERDKTGRPVLRLLGLNPKGETNPEWKGVL